MYTCQLSERKELVDALDHELLRLLREDGRASYEHLAQQVHLSRPAVHERAKRLHEQGVLRGYTALIDWSAVGFPLTVFIRIVAGGTARETAQSILALKSESTFVEECHSLTGEWCVMLKVRTRSPQSLERFIEQIRAVADVRSTLSSVVLSTFSEQETLHAHTDDNRSMFSEE